MARSERGLDRLVNFSDATVAIAITLLILPLVEAADDLRTESLLQFAGSHSGLLIAFAVSFAVIGRLWMLHHQFFETVEDYTRPVVALNCCGWPGSCSSPSWPTRVGHLGGPARRRRPLHRHPRGHLGLAHRDRGPLLAPAGDAAVVETPDLRAAVTPLAAIVLAGVLAALVPGGLLWLLLLIPGNIVEARLRG